MLALAGLPATVGFIGKLYLIEALVEGDYTWLAVFIAVGTMISLAYYLRVVAAMWMRPDGEAAPAPPRRSPAPRPRPTRSTPRPGAALPGRPGPARRRGDRLLRRSSRSRWSTSPPTPAPRCSPDRSVSSTVADRLPLRLRPAIGVLLTTAAIVARRRRRRLVGAPLAAARGGRRPQGAAGDPLRAAAAGDLLQPRLRRRSTSTTASASASALRRLGPGLAPRLVGREPGPEALAARRSAP